MIPKRSVGLILAVITTMLVVANQQEVGLARDEIVYMQNGMRYADWWIGLVKLEHGISKQKQHPFPLHKRFEASRRYREQQLVDALAELARLEVSRKSGGTAAELGLEMAVLRLGTR